MCAVASKSRATRKPASFGLAGAQKAPQPGFIAFCDPTLREHAPAGPAWVHEIKTDGYRAQLHIRRGRIAVYSRSGYDWTEEFAPIAAAARALASHDLIIDGEATVLGTTGLPDFQALRRELGNPQSKRLLFHAFDLLYLDGRDVRPAALIERKHALKALLDGAPPALVYVDFLEADGTAVFEHACRMGLEGIVSKRRDGPYRSGRQESWIKLKCVKSDTFPIIAFVEKLGARPRKIASLYLGKQEGGRLLYAGKVRSGYTEVVAREVRERLDPLIRNKTPLAVPVKKTKATWVEPVVDAEIEFSGITDDGLLRAAVFKGLRDDRAPSKRRAPPLAPADATRGTVHGVPRANILQLLPEAVAPSKQELAAYWGRVRKRALKYLGHRPLKLVRAVHGTIFYHKGGLPEIPAAVHQMKIEKREGGEGTRLWVESVEGLLGLVAMDAVELHPWNATVDDLEHPDRLVFDLDPGDGVAWEFVVETALKMRDLLQTEGLDSWPKLTGGKGLHLMAPVTPDLDHDEARLYCRDLSHRLEATAPARYLTVSDPTKRKGRIFIDYLRNGRGTTAIGAYSPRVRSGFPIAAPVTWQQIEKGVRPDAFTMKRPARR
jgi:bifunctional non-homologous end joining protein LigD